MAFRRKANLLLAHKPDIVIIPECEHPDKLKFESGSPLPTDIFWFGNNQHKGLGVFSYSNYKFELNNIHDPRFRTILPLAVKNKRSRFNLFAVWANNPDDRGFQYVGQVWKAINFYSDLLNDERTILVGDFNSNTIWDKPSRKGNHTDVVELLKSKNIFSVYHQFHKQVQGKEKHPTWFMYRHRDKSYHLDYCFASTDLIEKLQNVQVGTYRDWTRYSDHKPLSVTFNI